MSTDKKAKLRKAILIQANPTKAILDSFDTVESQIEGIQNDIEVVEGVANEALEVARETKEIAKGDKGEPGYTPIKNKDYFDGKDYVLTPDDKKEIAETIEVPIVEKKVIEKIETIIKEQPIVTNEIKEVAKYETGEQIVTKINALEIVSEKQIDASHIKNLPELVGQSVDNGFLHRGGASVRVDDEGTLLTRAATKIDFVGSGVTATASGKNVTVTIPGTTIPDISALPSTVFTPGSIIFQGSAGLLAQDNANLFWDDTNNRLGIGTNTPSSFIEANGGSTTTAENAYIYRTYTGTATATISGLRIAATYDPSANTAGQNGGMYNTASSAVGNVRNFTGAAGLVGMFNEAIHQGSGTMTEMLGERLLASVAVGAGAVTKRGGMNALMSSGAGTTVTTSRSFEATFIDSGTITTNQSFYSDASGASADFGLYLLNTKNYVSGRLGIGTDAPGVNLQIHASTGNTVAFAMSNADVTNLFTGVSFNPAVGANTFAQWAGWSSTQGGFQLNGFTDDDMTAAGIVAYVGSASPTLPAIAMEAWKTNGGSGRTAMSGTDKIFQIRAGDTPQVTFFGNGNVGIGTETITTGVFGAEVQKTTTLTSGTLQNVRINTTVTPTGSSSAGVEGLRVFTQSTGSQNITGALYGSIYSVQHAGSGTVNSASAFQGLTEVSGGGVLTTGIGAYARISGSASGGTITNGYGFVAGAANMLAGTVTNLYGLYVEDQIAGATLNYAIYTNAGLVRFGGAVTGATTIDATTGFKQNGGATSGNVLRGNGTNFVSAQLAYTDLSGTPAAAIPLSYLDTDGTLAANSDVKVATQKATKTYVDNAVTGLWEIKGSTDCSTNPNYPAASKGDAYIVTVAGKIGGASGKTVEIGDWYVAIADNAGGTEASVGTSWVVIQNNVVAAALTKADDTNVTLTLGGTPTSSLLQAVSITAGWTGQLAVSRGGTGASSISALSIWVANSANTITEVTPTAGKSIRINAGGTAWEAYTPGVGTVTSVSGTADRITSTGGATPVIDIAATYVGQASITTLGTITTGVWNGTAIANANLANSTISGVALGGTLAALTATDTSLTFSGSYTGATARTVGLNVGNANTWTALQTFNAKITMGGSSATGNTFVVSPTLTGTTGDHAVLNVTGDQTANNTTGSLYGAVFQPQFSGTGTLGNLVGFLQTPRNTSSGTVSQVLGSYLRIDNTSTGTITNATALYIAAPTNTGGGTITAKYGIAVDGGMGNGFGQLVPTALVHLGASTTSLASMNIDAGTAPTSPVEGGLWNDSTQKAYRTKIAGQLQTVVTNLFTVTSSAGADNTTTESTLIGTVVPTGGATIAANFLTVGKTIRIFGRGYEKAFGGPTLNIKVNFGSVTICTTGAQAMASAGSFSWELDVTMTCRTTGATGTVFTEGHITYTTTNTTSARYHMTNTATNTIDTTASNAIDVTATWSAATANNLIYGTNWEVDTKN